MLAGCRSRLAVVRPGSNAAKEGVASVVFGRRRRAEARKLQEALAAETERLDERRALSKKEPSVEEAAWKRVSQDFGFMVKPAFHTWRTFLDELQRFELETRLISAEPQTRVRFRLLDRDPADSNAALSADGAVLFDVSTDLDVMPSISMLFDAVRQMHRTAIPVHNVGLRDPFAATDTTWELEAFLHRECPLQVPVQNTFAGRNMKQSPPGPSSLPPAGSGGVAVASSTAVGRPVDQSPWVCVRSRLNNLSGDVTPQLTSMSLQGFTSLALRSLVSFLLAEYTPGIQTYLVLSRRHVKQEIEPVWHEMRQYAKMHRAELPIDMSRLAASPAGLPPGMFHGGF